MHYHYMFYRILIKATGNKSVQNVSRQPTLLLYVNNLCHTTAEILKADQPPSFGVQEVYDTCDFLKQPTTQSSINHPSSTTPTPQPAQHWPQATASVTQLNSTYILAAPVEAHK